ncbi:MAG: 2-dehydropantoate 2-reductase [Thermoleophilia bacterium]|nr:2-dehydropantoate 2-reductase [Thermoleophilia bacterium]
MVVIGAGAVGSYYGALLARAGHTVSLVARGAHRDALARSGTIRVREADGADWDARVSPRFPDAPADLAIVTTKSHHSADAARELRAHMGPSTLVLSLQNGVENPAVIRDALGGHPVLAGIAFVGLRIETPGEVRHEAEGWVRAGDPAGGITDASARLRDTVGDAWTLEISDDIVRAQWFKLLWNIGFNAMCAITGATAGETLATAGSRALVREAMREAVALAGAHGVTLTGDDVETMARYNPQLRDYRPSTAQDIAAGKPAERDALTGFVVRAGTRVGVDTPVNRVLDGLLVLQQDRATGRSAQQLAALDAASTHPT